MIATRLRAAVRPVVAPFQPAARLPAATMADRPVLSPPPAGARRSIAAGLAILLHAGLLGLVLSAGLRRPAEPLPMVAVPLVFEPREPDSALAPQPAGAPAPALPPAPPAPAAEPSPPLPIPPQPEAPALRPPLPQPAPPRPALPVPQTPPPPTPPSVPPLERAELPSTLPEPRPPPVTPQAAPEVPPQPAPQIESPSSETPTITRSPRPEPRPAPRSAHRPPSRPLQHQPAERSVSPTGEHAGPAVPSAALAGPAVAPTAAPAAAQPGPLVPPRAVAGMLGNRKPLYPSQARDRGDEGTVIVHVQVSAQGAPAAVTVARSSGHAALDEAALAAIRSWRFTPATRGGTPVAAEADIPVVFHLDD